MGCCFVLSASVITTGVQFVLENVGGPQKKFCVRVRLGPDEYWRMIGNQLASSFPVTHSGYEVISGWESQLICQMINKIASARRKNIAVKYWSRKGGEEN